MSAATPPTPQQPLLSHGAPQQHGYGQPQSPPPGMSIASLVLGIISLVCGFTLVVPGVGLVLGILGLRREPAGRGMAIGGIVLNLLALLVWVAIALVVVFVVNTAVVFGSAA